MNEIEGVIQQIRGPYGKGNNWFIMTLKDGQMVTGCKPSHIAIGDNCKFTGNYKESKYGQQFAASQFSVSMPKDMAGILEYLKRHMPGIGNKTGRAIVQHFRENIFSILDNEPERLAEIRGISQKKAEKIAEVYKEIKARQDMDIFYAENGITANLRARFVDALGDDDSFIIRQIKKNPYGLIERVDGFGFMTADRIFLSINNTDMENSYRINAGISHTLRDAENQGHCYLLEAELFKKASKLLSVSIESVIEAFKADRFEIEGNRVYNDDLYFAEKSVSEKLKQMLSCHNYMEINDISQKDFLDLSPDQQQAFRFATKNKVCIITGGPGTGKTHMLKMLLQAFSELEVALASPTGKAAKRMQESTGKQAFTIHRLLKYRPFEGFQHNEKNQLEYDVVIIDESSMIDIRLFSALLKAIPIDSRVVIVGDADQLPSVGPGRCLADMIKARVPTAMLTTLHRQESGSLIDLNAQKINNGQGIRGGNIKSDFIFCIEEDPETLADRIVKACKYYIDDNPQVLCPQKKGVIGVFNLNERLRNEVFNPDGEPVPGTFFRLGDRVIQLRNNYNLEIFNGDIGIITGIHEDKDKQVFIKIEFDTGPVLYPKHMIDDLQLAYALTIHKSQGSEFHTIIMPVHTQNYIMLKRQLLYTGITRGKKRVVLIGTEKAVNLAIKMPDTSVRYSALAERIKKERKID